MGLRVAAAGPITTSNLPKVTAPENREAIKRENNNVYDFSGFTADYVRLKADMSASSKKLP